jgi:hypothetical protein
MNDKEFSESFGDASWYIFMSPNGVVISSPEPLIGNDRSTLILNHHADFSTPRQYPKVGDRLDIYDLDKETGKYSTFPSDWVVFKIEKFVASEAMGREVFLVWCDEQPEFE